MARVIRRDDSVLGAVAVGGCLAAVSHSSFVRRAATKRVALFEEQFPEGDRSDRAGAAGRARAHRRAPMVADEIPEPVGTEFRLLYERQNFGMSLATR